MADGTLQSARAGLRIAGYCVACDRVIVRRDDGSCPEGHPPAAVCGRIVLEDAEEPPSLPRFNIAAFLVPPVWGPANGQWAGAIFLPMWLFADSSVAAAFGRAPVFAIVATFVVAATVAAQAFFALRANGLAYRRVCTRVSIAEFTARQRTWVYAAVPLATLLYGWGLYYRLLLAG